MSETSPPNPYVPPSTSELKLAPVSKPTAIGLLRVLLGGHVAAILIATVWAAVVRIESIITTGPCLAISGTLLAIYAYRRSETAIAKFALSTPAYATFLFLLINMFRLDPFEALVPVTILNTLYAMFSTIVGIRVIRKSLSKLA